MLEFLVRPLRSVLGVAEHEMATPLADTEREIVDAVNAIRRATDSIEHHVEVFVLTVEHDAMTRRRLR